MNKPREINNQYPEFAEASERLHDYSFDKNDKSALLRSLTRKMQMGRIISVVKALTLTVALGVGIYAASYQPPEPIVIPPSATGQIEMVEIYQAKVSFLTENYDPIRGSLTYQLTKDKNIITSGFLSAAAGTLSFNDLEPSTSYLLTFLDSGKQILSSVEFKTLDAPEPQPEPEPTPTPEPVPEPEPEPEPVYYNPSITSFTLTQSEFMLNLNAHVKQNDAYSISATFVDPTFNHSFPGTLTKSGNGYDVSASYNIFDYQPGSTVTIQLVVSYKLNGSNSQITSTKSITLPFVDLVFNSYISNISISDKVVTISGVYSPGTSMDPQLSCTSDNLTFGPPVYIDNGDGSFNFTFTNLTSDNWYGGNFNYTITADYLVAGVSHSKAVNGTYTISGFQKPTDTSSYAKATGLINLNLSTTWTGMTLTSPVVTLTDGNDNAVTLASTEYSLSGTSLTLNKSGMVPYLYASNAKYKLNITGNVDGDLYEQTIPINLDTTMNAPTVTSTSTSVVDNVRRFTFIVSVNDAVPTSLTNFVFKQNGTTLTGDVRSNKDSDTQYTVSISSDNFSQATAFNNITLQLDYNYPGNTSPLTATSKAASFTIPGYRITGLQQNGTTLVYTASLTGNASSYVYSLKYGADTDTSTPTVSESNGVLTITYTTNTAYASGTQITFRITTATPDGGSSWSENISTLN